MPGTGGIGTTIDASVLEYLRNLTDRIATYVNSTTVSVNAFAAYNSTLNITATVNEFDIYINGQYIDKAAYTWIPNASVTQTIVFNIVELGYDISVDDLIVINGRWA